MADTREQLEARWQDVEARIQGLHGQGLQGSPEEALLLIEHDAIEHRLVVQRRDPFNFLWRLI